MAPHTHVTPSSSHVLSPASQPMGQSGTRHCPPPHESTQSHSSPMGVQAQPSGRQASSSGSRQRSPSGHSASEPQPLGFGVSHDEPSTQMPPPQSSVQIQSPSSH